MTQTQSKELPINLTAIAWPFARLGDAIEALGQRAGLPVQSATPPVPRSEFANVKDDLDEWVQGAARFLGISAEPIDLVWKDVLPTLRSGAPCICRLPEESGAGFILIRNGRGSRVTLLAPDLSEHRLSVHTVREILCGHLAKPLREDATAMLNRTSARTRNNARVVEALTESRLRHYPIQGWWKLSPPPQDRFRYRLKQARAKRDLSLLLGLHTLRYVLWILSWWLLGEGALSGRFDPGWMAAWGLLLITIIPIRTAEVKLQGRLSLTIGGALKERLLTGAMKMDPEQIRRQGYGELLGRVHESEAIESLAFGGGVGSALALVEIVMAISVLAVGAAGFLHATLLFGWITVVMLLLFAFRKRLTTWTSQRVQITGAVVENMVGHRTRLAQERPEERHRNEDRLVEEYLKSSHAKDWLQTLITSLGSRGWIVVGLIGLAPAFIAGESGSAVAISVGGILLANSGLTALLSGVSQLITASVAWKQVAPLYTAASKPQEAGHPDAVISTRSDKDDTVLSTPLVTAENLVFRHREKGRAVIQGSSLTISEGEKILLEGSSGGGKSTLASMLLGLREPESGLLLIEGLDRKTLGPEGWRNRIVAAPQFHENHVLIGTFAFNLLMGRHWPPRSEDMQEAMEVCGGLGLGPLLERMPGGMGQMVGETGWQLSHGERSRLFIARALLQRSQLIVLDESFGSLDPETLQHVVEYVTKRSQTLLAIAHP